MKITIIGGYGYRNAGDEAQLASNLARWRRHAPGCRFTVLSPDVAYTESLHGSPDMEVYPATRIVWFHSNKRAYYFLDTARFREKFKIISRWNKTLARLAVTGLPLSIFCTRKNTLLHDTFRKSDALFISGGGFLTGSTLSRLWDTMLAIQIAGIYGVPVLVSGQTLGALDAGDAESFRLARKSFKIPELVYTRDNDLSIKAALEWGVPQEKLSTGADDALFSPAASLDEINALSDGNLEQNRYIALNVHYWGSTREDSSTIVKKIASLCDYINRRYSLKTALVAMSPVDEEALLDTETYMETEAIRFNFDYDPRLTRGVIANAKLCLTMKHHPIVFAMGEKVPCIAFYTDEYYQHKNTGALELFGMESFSVGISETPYEAITQKVDQLIVGYEKYTNSIETRLASYEKKDSEIILRWLDRRRQRVSQE